jgi:EpsI family protein
MPWIEYAGMLALLGSTLLASHLTSKPFPEPLQRPLASISSEIDGWEMRSAEELNLQQLAATSYIARNYWKKGQQLGVLIAFHDSHQGAVNLHSPKNCLPGDGWEIWKTVSPAVRLGGQPVLINQYRIYRMGQRMTVLYWYQSRGRVIANEYMAKLMLLRDGLFDGRTSGSLVRIALNDEPQLVSQALQFAEALMPQVQRCFRP